MISKLHSVIVKKKERIPKTKNTNRNMLFFSFETKKRIFFLIDEIEKTKKEKKERDKGKKE